MKAAVLHNLDHMVVQEVELPAMDADSILMKVEAVGICGSDIRIYHHGNSRVQLPQILGHEASGRIAAVGANVTKFNVGDRISLGADVPCGECVFCEAGIGNNCQINYAMGYQFAGSFADYVLLNKMVVNFGPIHRIPDHVSHEEAALAEPLACVINALELSNVRLGDSVVVIGAGPIGCMLVEVAKMMGATKVILVQRSRPRLELAKQFGAHAYICSNEENAIERVLEETGGLGADVVITSNPSPEAQVDAIHMAKNRARVNFFGGLPKGKSLVTLDTNIIHYKELFVHGAHGSLPAHHQKAIDLIASGAIDMKKYISHTFPLERIQEAIETAESHVGMRVIVKP
ncbi:alcohol dehydrogenase catalytic domain-containing protein [Paenibacillus sacheonensis]|uniref:Alcohol dehydrogenase catalytic domain-containing protein n=1 Tax=Paenibacillus sacheonensis TaxID=742054 RepID=A0A7X5BVU7_9BACL|nr:alcohol dehydrogenase catalytic domain-containing protein [Paenibacillus sacheonensis]MBM7565953.1 L-iditol 2-dehydrogenase [Paenibacillus sacheonensis]NBC68733.1 alcohol dehydrogenase catalytic domain-containing protein [Paenibacillus sacheonensis]